MKHSAPSLAHHYTEMRICIVGKYPPIEGGVSAHTYWSAHGLAALGHQVHIVTNANEVEQPFCMWMRQEDWRKCETEYPSGGYVRVHWTDDDINRQRHVPWSNPFVTKLASTAADVVRERDLELIFSYYLEPYGIAAHLAATITAKPHVIKPAGSDFGRLRQRSQFRPLYDYVLQSAARVVLRATDSDAVETWRLWDGDDFRLPETVFVPYGPCLDIARFERELAASPDWPQLRIGRTLGVAPTIGIYGKIGEPKGTFDLLQALALLRRKGRRFHLLAMVHGWDDVELAFRDTLSELSLDDWTTQLPFLPNWRVPEFLRLCDAVCFLERDFPIAGHRATVPREVLACGRCLIASASILRQQQTPERLVNGWNCLAVEHVRDPAELAAALETVLESPAVAAEIGTRGACYSQYVESHRKFPHNYERLFSDTISGRSIPKIRQRFAWCTLAAELLPGSWPERGTSAFALSVYHQFLDARAGGDVRNRLLFDVVQFEVYAEGLLSEYPEKDDSLWRLRPGHSSGLCGLRPTMAPGIVVREFEHDVDALARAYESGEQPSGVSSLTCWAAFLPGGRVFRLDREAALLLACCDGTSTVEELAKQVDPNPFIQEYICHTVMVWFEAGLVWFRNAEPLSA